MVKQVQAGCDLIRLLSSLPENRKLLAIAEISPARPGFPAPSEGAYFPARFIAKAICPCRKSVNSIPRALSAFG
jgi:hypothetical protein